jgi:RNA-splicing ligase RtcB
MEVPMEKVTDRLYNWASDIDGGTLEQALRTSRLGIVTGHVALMPDAHLGMGATVGSVIPTEGAIIPAAVGVDIGCGMIAVETTLSANDLPDSLERYLPVVATAIPAGLGRWHAEASIKAETWFAANRQPLSDELTKRALEQFGTLGSGNHFFEVCLDENEAVWIVLHSGSRGVGNKLASAHIERAKLKAETMEYYLEDPDLAFFMEGDPAFNEYISDLLWAQRYAAANRAQMMDQALAAFFAFVRTGAEKSRINCHHNFTAREIHQGRPMWITRKGAIKADVNDLGIIPGSMGTRSYIVRGKGNEDSYHSCSHGAGRRMSRGQARRSFTGADLTAQMGDRVWQTDNADQLVDEIPSSYKDIDQVMADQTDLVEVLHSLTQILNYKGTDSRRKRR